MYLILELGPFIDYRATFQDQFADSRLVSRLGIG